MYQRRSLLKSQPFRAIAKFRHSEKGLTIIETTLAIAIFSFLVVFCLGIFIHIGRVYYHGLYENRVQEATRNIITTISESLRTSGVEVEELHYSGDSGPRKDNGWHGYCIGNVKYSYRLNTQLLDPAEADPLSAPNYESIDNPPPPPPNLQHDLHPLHPLDAQSNPDVGSHQLNYDEHVFLVSRSCEAVGGALKAVPNSLAGSGINESVELLDERMRIIYFSIKPATPGDSSLYDISLKIAYGGYADTPAIDSEVFVYEELDTSTPPIDKVKLVAVPAIPAPVVYVNKVKSGDYQILHCRQGETFCAVSEARTKVFRKIR